MIPKKWVLILLSFVPSFFLIPYGLFHLLRPNIETHISQIIPTRNNKIVLILYIVKYGMQMNSCYLSVNEPLTTYTICYSALINDRCSAKCTGRLMVGISSFVIGLILLLAVCCMSCCTCIRDIFAVPARMTGLTQSSTHVHELLPERTIIREAEIPINIRQVDLGTTSKREIALIIHPG